MLETQRGLQGSSSAVTGQILLLVPSFCPLSSPLKPPEVSAPSDGASPLLLAEENSHCGGLLTNASGSFSSPWYPKKYPTNVVCAWDIQVDVKAHVRLKFEVVK